MSLDKTVSESKFAFRYDGLTSKSGQRDIRRLLIIGAMAVISGTKARPPAEGSQLGCILARKPRMLAAIALANKMARMLWAMN